MSCPIHFGVAGWSYPDWQGIVYPGRVPDKLQFLARYVDLIEINSSFYRPPAAKDTASWVQRTAFHSAFFFTAKLHRQVTHERVVDPAAVRAFREGFGPMVEAGKLRQLLAQFRYDFADSQATRDHLRRVKDAFGSLAEVVVEVRHASWQAPESLEFLESLGVTVANLDYPIGRDSFHLRECLVGSNGYLRLHGRNRKAWFDRNAGRDETYNYDYSRTELEDVRDRAISLARRLESLTIVANNHYRGKEIANVLELKWMIGGAKVPVPSGLLAEYPRLQEIAVRESNLI